MAVLAGVPLLALVAVEVAARREKTLYVASVLGAAGRRLVRARPQRDRRDLQHDVRRPGCSLPWSAFALALAYAYGLRLMLAAGLLLALGFLNALVAASAGIDWSVSPARPEPLVAMGALVFAGSFTGLARRERFPETWRLVGTVAALLPILFLSVWPMVFSYHLLPAHRRCARSTTRPASPSPSPASGPGSAAAGPRW